MQQVHHSVQPQGVTTSQLVTAVPHRLEKESAAWNSHSAGTRPSESLPVVFTPTLFLFRRGVFRMAVLGCETSAVVSASPKASVP